MKRRVLLPFALITSLLINLPAQATVVKLGGPCIKLVKLKGGKARLSPGTFQEIFVRNPDGTRSTMLFCK